MVSPCRSSLRRRESAALRGAGSSGLRAGQLDGNRTPGVSWPRAEWAPTRKVESPALLGATLLLGRAAIVMDLASPPTHCLVVPPRSPPSLIEPANIVAEPNLIWLVRSSLPVNGQPVLPIGASSTSAASLDGSREAGRRGTSQSDRGAGSDSDSDGGDVLPSDRSPKVNALRGRVSAARSSHQASRNLLSQENLSGV